MVLLSPELKSKEEGVKRVIIINILMLAVGAIHISILSSFAILI